MTRLLLTLWILVAASTYADYVEARTAAAKLQNERKFEAAVTAFTELGSGDYSDFQKSDALYQAAECARQLKRYAEADSLADQIPIATMAKSALMQTLEAQRKFKELVAAYQGEDLDAWPDYEALGAYVARGRANLELGNGAPAEEDLRKATALITYRNDKPAAAIWVLLGLNREQNLKDDAAALEAYGKVIDMVDHGSGGSTHFTGLLAAARILRNQQKYDEAIALAQKLDPGGRTGAWRANALLSIGETQAAAGRKDEAIATFSEILAMENVKAQQNAAQAAMARLEGGGAK